MMNENNEGFKRKRVMKGWELGGDNMGTEEGKNKKEERKKEENYIETGEKALKMHLFGS